MKLQKNVDSIPENWTFTQTIILILCCVAGIGVVNFLGFSRKAKADTVPTVAVGSKPFTENFILAELAAQIMEGTGKVKVKRKLGLGGTGIVFSALDSDEIQVYIEYTGTISRAILKRPELTNFDSLQDELNKRGLMLSKPLGFNNTYALAIRKGMAEERGIQKISDLKGHRDLVLGFHHEFLNRKDGWVGLKEFYGLEFDDVRGLDHALAYGAIQSKKIDMLNAYSTDAKISRFDLQVLEDDRNFFPLYHAVFIVKKDFPEKYPKAWEALIALEGQIDDGLMASLNAKVEIDKQSFAEVASGYLGITYKGSSPWAWKTLKRFGLEHAYLVGVSLIIAILIGVPFGVLATRNRFFAQFALLSTGLLQTIPSLALFGFLIPVLGIGEKPALVALTFYALLPIVRNTYTGIDSIEPSLVESARALGLRSLRRLFLIELPIASPSILAGIKTSTIMTIGTATIASLIGAGGFGDPIITGLSIHSNAMILSGAVPAAGFAILMHGVFEVLDRFLISEGIRS